MERLDYIRAPDVAGWSPMRTKSSGGVGNTEKGTFAAYT